MKAIAPLNPWLGATLTRAARMIEDADRISHAAAKFLALITRVHELATVSAHVTPAPTLERLQVDEGTLLSLEWLDKSSGWYLMIGVRKPPMQKARAVLEFSGSPAVYATDNPTDDDITKALHDYFEGWKRA